MRFHCSPESTHKGEVTTLAIVETVVSMGIAILIAVRYHTITHIAGGVVLAPLLLLRTEHSVRYCHWLYARQAGPWVWPIWFPLLFLRPVLSFFFGLVGAPVFVLIMMLSRKSPSKFPGRSDPSFISYVSIVWGLASAVMAPLAAIAVVLQALVARIIAAVVMLVRHPVQSIRAVPGNWFRVCLATDAAHVPEILPGVETIGEYWNSLCRYRPDEIRALSFSGMLGGVIAKNTQSSDSPRIIQFLEGPERGHIPLPAMYSSTFFFFVLGYGPALLFRYSLKATSVIYLPLLWIVGRTSWTPSALDESVGEITGLQLERLKRVLAWIVLSCFTAAPLVISYYWCEVRAKLAGKPLAAYFFPVEEVNSWHIARFLSAFLTLALFYYTDWLRPRLSQLSAMRREWNLTGINLTKMGRSASSLFTIACGIYLISLNTEWSRVPVIRLLPSSPRHIHEREIGREIAMAKETIHLWASSVTNGRVQNALIHAHGRGISVEVIVDRAGVAAAYSGVPFLSKAGVAVFVDGMGDLVKDGVMILDGRKVITGPFSFAEEAGGKEDTASLLIPAGPLSPVRRYLEEYMTHRGHSVSYVRPPRGK